MEKRLNNVTIKNAPDGKLEVRRKRRGSEVGDGRKGKDPSGVEVGSESIHHADAAIRGGED